MGIIDNIIERMSSPSGDPMESAKELVLSRPNTIETNIMRLESLITVGFIPPRNTPEGVPLENVHAETEQTEPVETPSIQMAPVINFAQKQEEKREEQIEMQRLMREAREAEERARAS